MNQRATDLVTCETISCSSDVKRFGEFSRHLGLLMKSLTIEEQAFREGRGGMLDVVKMSVRAPELSELPAAVSVS
jgi:hypothetical protein